MVCNSIVCAPLAAVSVVLIRPLSRSLEFCTDQLSGLVMVGLVCQCQCVFDVATNAGMLQVQPGPTLAYDSEYIVGPRTVPGDEKWSVWGLVPILIFGFEFQSVLSHQALHIHGDQEVI